MFSDPINLQRYVTHIATPIFVRGNLLHFSFQQQSARVHTTDSSMRCSDSVFGERVIDRGL
jgi:hypothetical protein